MKTLDKEKINKLYRYAISLTHNDDLAFDLVHEAILKSQKYFIINLEAYLKKCVRNIFYDLQRKNNRERDFFEEETVDSVSFENILLARNEVAYLLNKMTPEERELLFLSCVENYSYKEISKIMGIKIGTVMSRLNRCKEKIRRQCEERPQK